EPSLRKPKRSPRGGRLGPPRTQAPSGTWRSGSSRRWCSRTRSRGPGSGPSPGGPPASGPPSARSRSSQILPVLLDEVGDLFESGAAVVRLGQAVEPLPADLHVAMAPMSRGDAGLPGPVVKPEVLDDPLG